MSAPIEPTGLFSWIPALFDKFQGWLVTLLPDWLGNGFSDLASSFGPTLQYFGWMLGLDAILPIIIGAYIAKFLIRRIPIIG